MAAKDDCELELIKAQTALALAQTQTQTEFWKVGIAALAAGAIFGGLAASLLP
jgi:hypothetical protein